MAYLIHDSTGAAVSVGSYVADPLPAGLTAVGLTPAQAHGIRNGTMRWDAATRTVVDVPPDPAVVVEATITGRLRAQLAAIVTPATGLIDAQRAARNQAAADIDAALTAIMAAQAVIDDPASTTAQKNAARTDREFGRVRLDAARHNRQAAALALDLLRTQVMLLRLVIRGDLLLDDTGTAGD